METHDIQRTLDSLREGFQIIDFDWHYVYVNPAAASHGRRTAEALTGRLIWDAYPGIETTPLFQAMQECMANRSSRVLEHHFTFPDGAQRWFEIRIQAVPEGICIYSADIHQRKVAELLDRGRRQPASRLRGWLERWRRS